ncbi:conserved hypothetical protein [Xanthomonas citri pv. citri]|nr:conserved hypothetical protein [Xanthomonas citri pv. citri]CEE51680.1 conserved hypothetical protein [Xanthomonas citri pv. citri]
MPCASLARCRCQCCARKAARNGTLSVSGGAATGARAAAWLEPGESGDAPDPQAVTPAASNAGAKNTARMRSSR